MTPPEELNTGLTICVMIRYKDRTGDVHMVKNRSSHSSTPFDDGEVKRALLREALLPDILKEVTGKVLHQIRKVLLHEGKRGGRA